MRVAEGGAMPNLSRTTACVGLVVISHVTLARADLPPPSNLTDEKADVKPLKGDDKVQFSLEDADLPELIKVMGQLTGKRFVVSGKVKNIKATIYSAQKVTVAEAYQAFLTILETNGLTVIPQGQYYKIVESPGVVTNSTPVYGTKSKSPIEDRYVTRLHRLAHANADDIAKLLATFKSKDGDVTAYAAGNLLIITDTGTNIARLMEIVAEVDVAAAGDKVWVETLHYASAKEIVPKLTDTFAGAPKEARITKVVAEERTNAVIIVGTEKGYAQALELIKRIDLPLNGDGEVHVLPLQHADAEEMAKTLADVTGKSAPAGSKTTFDGAVKITADKATNALVITASLRDYAALRMVIDKLDHPRRQVFIETVIMEVASDHGERLGFSFHGGDGLDSLGATVVGGSNAAGTGFPSSLSFPGTTDATTLQGLALGVRSSETLALGSVGLSVPAFGIAMQFVATSSDSNVLATPHLMATDNIPAEINVGENVPLQSSTLAGIPGLSSTSTASSATSGFAFGSLGGVTRQNVGTKIKLVPHINDSNEVRLEVEEEISEVGTAVAGSLNPSIVQRNAKTQLVVQDQQTIVIGGLVRDAVQSGETKVPVLGDIPLIGVLFKQSSKQKVKRNLLLVLTPYVIRDPADLRAIFERKMRERQEFIDRYFVFGDKTKWQPTVDWSRTRGLVEEIRQAHIKLEEKAALDAASKPSEVKTHDAQPPL